MVGASHSAGRVSKLAGSLGLIGLLGCGPFLLLLLLGCGLDALGGEDKVQVGGSDSADEPRTQPAPGAGAASGGRGTAGGTQAGTAGSSQGSAGAGDAGPGPGADGGGVPGVDAGPESAGDASATEQPEPVAGETGRLVGITAAHNAVRAAVDTSTPLPPLRWSSELAAYAQEWADLLAQDCNARHRDNLDSYGENLAVFGAAPDPPASTPQDTVSGWADEQACWTYGGVFTTDSCDMGCTAALFSDGCGHYTQIVWRDSTELGCAVSTCSDGGFLWDIWVCNYSPAGNFVGEVPY